jgi:hypothetical protein
MIDSKSETSEPSLTAQALEKTSRIAKTQFRDHCMNFAVSGRHPMLGGPLSLAGFGRSNSFERDRP